MADGVRMISENTAKFAGGPYMSVRYGDMIHPKKQDTRTGDEIVEDIVRKAGLVIV